MAHTVIEDVEDRAGARVIRRKIYRTDDDTYPSGYRYALRHRYVDGRGVILRYDNENRTPGRHEKHTPGGVEAIEFPGMVPLRDRFLEAVAAYDPTTDPP